MDHMRRAGIIAAVALTIPILAGCGGDPAAPSPSPATPSPAKPAHLVTGSVAPDWNAEMAGQPWADAVVSVDWLEGTPWLRIVVADSTAADDVILICRTGLKFYMDHTGGDGQVVRVHDSLGQVAQGASGRCLPVSNGCARAGLSMSEGPALWYAC